MMEHILLLVDDEENITASLMRLLRHDGYQVLTANSAKAALEILQQYPAGVVVTDQRMPEMTGVELLTQVKNLYPNTVRIVLTGYTDLETVTDAINRGAVYKFLAKPWDDNVLRANIHEAFRHYDLIQEKERLAHEIHAANAELQRINLDLERVVQDKHQQLVRVAHYDALTGLPNRLLFGDRLQQAVARANRTELLVAVLFLDLDRFKNVNETLGHPAGDQLLQSVAERLAVCTRESDSIARLGGDEFALILADLADAQNAAHAAEKILAVLAPPFEVEGHEIFVSASIGISVYPADGVDTTVLVKNAETAMYHAKGQGKSNFQYYARQMNASALQRLTLENSLRRALEREEFQLRYQPQLELGGGKIIGVEALLRWNHPEQGLLSPERFISLLEETSLIIPVGEWVLHTAFLQNKTWHEAGLPAIRMAVNLSALQFRQADLVGAISQILQETGLDPASHELELELTESLIMNDVEETVVTLNKLHAMGIKISIDDFGTGYSSLSYLKRFPISSLKIDRTFVRDLSTNPDDAAIVGAIIALGHSLKLKVIAEGVETAKQLEFLRAMQCDEMQGFYFSRPVPAAEITEMLLQGSGLRQHGEE
jgi:diguanylate cyclase (GGDEF)-like protein